MLPEMLTVRLLQVLGACSALACAAPTTARAQAKVTPPTSTSAQASSAAYVRMRARLKAVRVTSPDQVIELRGKLAGRTVEISGRVAGVVSNRRQSSILLECTGADGQKQTVSLGVTPELAADARSMGVLRPDAEVRVLARVQREGVEPMLVPLAALGQAQSEPLFREQDDSDLLILSPANALPRPKIASRMTAPEGSPSAFQSLPKPRVLPSPRSSRGAASGSASRAGSPSARAVPSLTPWSPQVRASAQKRAPQRQAQRARAPQPRQAPAAEPVFYADDERIEAQMPAYRNLVRRFNKKLSADLVEEIASGLLSAAYSQNMDPRFLAAIVAVESDFDPRCLSSSGAMGLGQVMPFNMPEVGMQKADAWNPTKNLLATAMLLRGHLDDFKSRPNGTLLAVAAYNAGPNAVKRAGYKVPSKNKQVQRYVWKVYHRYKEFAPELFR